MPLKETMGRDVIVTIDCDALFPICDAFFVWNDSRQCCSSGVTTIGALTKDISRIYGHPVDVHSELFRFDGAVETFALAALFTLNAVSITELCANEKVPNGENDHFYAFRISVMKFNYRRIHSIWMCVMSAYAIAAPHCHAVSSAKMLQWISWCMRTRCYSAVTNWMSVCYVCGAGRFLLFQWQRRLNRGHRHLTVNTFNKHIVFIAICNLKLSSLCVVVFFFFSSSHARQNQTSDIYTPFVSIVIYLSVRRVSRLPVLCVLFMAHLLRERININSVSAHETHRHDDINSNVALFLFFYLLWFLVFIVFNLVVRELLLSLYFCRCQQDDLEWLNVEVDVIQQFPLSIAFCKALREVAQFNEGCIHDLTSMIYHTRYYRYSLNRLHFKWEWIGPVTQRYLRNFREVELLTSPIDPHSLYSAVCVCVCNCLLSNGSSHSVVRIFHIHIDFYF